MKTTIGVVMNVSDTDWNKMPIPASIIKTPVIIGFLVYAYGPSVINFCGGLIGTGVPFAFRNLHAHHTHTEDPTSKKGIEINML